MRIIILCVRECCDPGCCVNGIYSDHSRVLLGFCEQYVYPKVSTFKVKQNTKWDQKTIYLELYHRHSIILHRVSMNTHRVNLCKDEVHFNTSQMSPDIKWLQHGQL